MYVNVIVGRVTGPSDDRTADTNPTTKVVRRFDEGEWTREGEYLVMTHLLPNLAADDYLRVRGTNTQQMEPEPDPLGENPWDDLWFYSNPIFIDVP